MSIENVTNTILDGGEVVAYPPEPIFSDYLEMTTLVLMFIIGAPLNLAAYTQLAERPTTSRLDLLKRHLNYSDLLVIFVYVPSRACWLLTYDWRGGDVLCRVVKMMHTVAFQSSSNVIVCIALDRLFSVFSVTRHSPEKANQRIRILLAGAWTTAIIIALPQLIVWRNYVPFQHINWSQCLQIWEITRHENPVMKHEAFNAEAWYSIVHIGLIFWIPTIIIVVSFQFSICQSEKRTSREMSQHRKGNLLIQMCYVMVLSWVFINSRPSISRGGNRTGSLQTGCETVDTIITRTSAPPRIVVSDESTLHLTTRPSIVSSEGSAIVRTSVHNSQSYHASVNRSRAVRVSFLLVAAYIICWLPYNLLSLVHIIDKQLFKNSFNKFYFLHEFMVFNSVVNPYLYGLFNHSDKIRRRVHE
ncbi:unnamed protein product [Angiostrongylus costaricensis]|uniref:G_PROTEIN_RECEP_F1_2 domain-containing protein n=1 Tax=Angiostrongylus costaricensis TaxID=334426 RepID=A0A0R3PJ00_ANGCS|nr:unnamed protein product [Angiostrongylus costaricensis]